MSAMSKIRRRPGALAIALIPLALAVVGIAAGVAWYERGGADSAASETESTLSIGGPFSLIDQNGNTVTDQTFAGSYRLIYFGYSFCPDACPTELQVMADAVAALGPDGQKVQPIFVTIDPARDTPKQLANYVPLFDKRLVGLTGTPQQVAEVARAYRVYYARADQSDAYAMNHSSFVYLMDPKDKFLTVFSSDTSSDKMAAAIRDYMKRSS
jgi:protein SCO1/2